MIERLTISLINLKTIQADDFDVQISGAVLLNDSGRKKVITAWQNKKKEIILHPFLREKVAIGLFPYVQATLMAKYIRGEKSGTVP
jgi:CRISPR-associated protein Cas1